MALPSRVVLAGGTGLIGRSLTAALRSQGVVVDVLTRGDTVITGLPHPTVLWHWEPGGMLDLEDLQYDAVINLAGSSIAHMPWTARRRAEIFDSRMRATQSLVDWMHDLPVPPRTFISASAVGFYGSRGDEVLTENSSAGTGFLTDVVTAWEAEANEAPDATRVVTIRTGLVLADEGALTPLRRLTGMFLGGPLGSGEQWWPWISLRDEVRAIIHLLDSDVSGPVNLVAPQPATMREIGRALAAAMKRPFWLRAPGFAIRALLGKAGKELLLSSQKVTPSVLLADGFAFDDTSVESAIAAALEVPAEQQTRADATEL